jgi:hypothetical protein
LQGRGNPGLGLEPGHDRRADPPARKEGPVGGADDGLLTKLGDAGRGKFRVRRYQKIVPLQQGRQFLKLAVNHPARPFQEGLGIGLILHHAGNVVKGLEGVIHPRVLGLLFKNPG